MKAAPLLATLAGPALLAIALLLPVGDAPWFSFWREWVAAIALLAIVVDACVTLRGRGLPLRIEARSLPTLAVALAAVCWLQLACGRLFWISDALLPSLYLAGFAVAVAVAASLPEGERGALLDRLAAAFAAAALLSVPIAVAQWLGWSTLDLGMPVVDGRPVAHMEQANLLCSLEIQGALALWRLCERGRLGRRWGFLLALPLVFTIVLTQSRVAWMVCAALAVARLWRRDALRRSADIACALAFAAVLGSLLLPAFDHSLGLAGASLGDRMSEGRRPAVWSLFADALCIHPWSGWGVLQNGAAQFALADSHPSLGWSFSSAHDLPLDLMVWFGIPLGLLAAAALAWAIVARLARAADAAAAVTAMAAVALGLHALVELPLQYSYFLLPLGLMLGATAPSASGAGWRRFAMVRGWIAAIAIPPALVLALLANDYRVVADAMPARAADPYADQFMLLAPRSLPDVLVLDERRAFNALAATPRQPGLEAPVIETARAAMLRSPFPLAISRYALIAALNGRTADASDALTRICRFETAAACAMSQRTWWQWCNHWPQLPPWPGSTASP